MRTGPGRPSASRSESRNGVPAPTVIMPFGNSEVADAKGHVLVNAGDRADVFVSADVELHPAAPPR